MMDAPIPFPPAVQQAMMPSVPDIVAAVHQLVARIL